MCTWLIVWFARRKATLGCQGYPFAWALDTVFLSWLVLTIPFVGSVCCLCYSSTMMQWITGLYPASTTIPKSSYITPHKTQESSEGSRIWCLPCCTILTHTHTCTQLNARCWTGQALFGAFCCCYSLQMQSSHYRMFVWRCVLVVWDATKRCSLFAACRCQS